MKNHRASDRVKTMIQQFDKNQPRTQVVTVSVQELNQLIEKQVAKQVQKSNTKFMETFIGQITLACATALATAYVTQMVFGRRK